MGYILRSQKMAEIILLPVRHHSPACARHIQRMIEKRRPSMVLIEGPENANALIPVLVHPETQAPVAIYYSFSDKSGKITEEKGNYKCYYPFLDYSPELCALRTSTELGIPAEFIDLSYGEILIACQEGKGLRKEAERHNYNDDYYLTQNEYLKKLCEKAQLRNFDEFWEKYFEINPDPEDDEKWFEDLLRYCGYARENSSIEELQAEGCLAREAHMAQRIREAAEKIGPEGFVLVVTGGFHTPGLQKLLETEPGNQKKKTRSGIGSGEQNVYLMPYSMEAADALNGYASGMPFPGFYQKVWERQKKREVNPEQKLELQAAFANEVLDQLVRTGKETRKKEGSPSTYDEICACQMAEGLAALRGKKYPGAYELYDAVLSSYVKGEYNLATSRPMDILRKSLTGRQIGKLWEGAEVPPLLTDYRKICKSYGLKIDASLEKEVTLNIFSSEKHRKMSMFFHRLDFLGIGFAKMIKGPDLSRRKGRNLIREIWKYKWTIGVDTALIEHSVFGGTVEEAVLSLVKNRLKEEMSAAKAANILAHVFEMGLSGAMYPIYNRLMELIQRENDFYSLADALKSILTLKELAGLYESELEFDEMIRIGVRKMILLLPSMTGIRDEELEKCMQALKLLYQLTGRVEISLSDQRETYFEYLQKMKLDSQIHSGLNGCIHGILYGGNQETEEKVRDAAKGYLTGTKEQMQQVAAFLHGLFFTARDLVFSGEFFMKMLDDYLAEADEEEFMELLPELRIAFSYFTPREIDKLAENAAAFHQISGQELMSRQVVLPKWFAYGRELDQYVRQLMEKE